MRILIAEDDLVSRSILTAILKRWGFDPVAAADGQAAWDILQKPAAPRLVLMDWNMPGLDGPQVCRKIREIESSDPPYIILLTARGEKSDIVEGLEAGANDYVSKPYDHEELQARIRVGRRMLELQAHLMEARDALEHQATFDPLTEIFNRRAILERLSQEISRAKRDNGAFSVGMCDIDHFKSINDTHGHLAGDEALVAFSRCLKSSLRDYDALGRYGGEEFLVIAPGPMIAGGGGLYERLRARVAAAPFPTLAGPLSLTVSIGAAPGTGRSTVDGLLAAADAALYRAKAEGRDRVVNAEEALFPVPEHER